MHSCKTVRNDLEAWNRYNYNYMYWFVLRDHCLWGRTDATFLSGLHEHEILVFGGILLFQPATLSEAHADSPLILILTLWVLDSAKAVTVVKQTIHGSPLAAKGYWIDPNIPIPGFISVENLSQGSSALWDWNLNMHRVLIGLNQTVLNVLIWGNWSVPKLLHPYYQSHSFQLCTSKYIVLTYMYVKKFMADLATAYWWKLPL